MDTEQKAGGERGFGDSLVRWAVAHPVSVCVIFACMMGLGAVSSTRIPVVLTPDVSFPFVSVNLPYANATPGQVLESIVKPVEEALSTVPGVLRMSSRSDPSGGWVGLAFNWGDNVDMILADVREKIDGTRPELPSDLERINVRNWSTNDEPVISGQFSSRRDLRNAFDFLDARVKKPLERVEGVAEVNLFGVWRREVDIYLRLADVRRHRVDVGSLFRRLDSANINLTLGRVVDGTEKYEAITRGVIRDVEELKNFPVDGRGLVLSDVADIVYDKPLTTSGRHLNGTFAVGLDIRKTSQANTVETVTGIHKKLAEIEADPAMEGIKLQIWWDAAQQINKAIAGLLEAGTIGALLAVAVLYVYLRRLAPTLVIGFAIPFSIVAAIGFMYLLGKTLNVLSMMGLMLACGMLVDNAVVVLESIYQNIEKGRDRITAAVVGTREVVSAVIAATLTSIIIFVPLVFGKKTNLSIWLSDTGGSIILSLLCSLFISLTLIPLAVGRFLPAKHITYAAGQAKRHRVRDRYVRTVSWSLRHPFLVGFLIVPALMAATVWQMGRVPDNSPEAQDLQDLTIQYDFSENYHYARIEKDYVNPIERFLLKNKERFKIKDVSSDFSNNEASTRVYFDKERITLEELKKVRAEMAKEIPVLPGADIKLGRQEGAESQNFIGVNVFGEDPAKLQELAKQARTLLRAKPGFSEIHTDLERGREEVQIRVNRDIARKYNISTQNLANVLSIVVRGQEVRGYRTPEGEVDIWVRLQASDRNDLTDLRQIVVGSGPDGRDITLEQVAGIEIVKTPANIQREDRRTFTWMWIVYGGDKKDEGKKIVTEVLNSINYPQGYGWTYGFWTRRSEQEDNEFLFNLLFALAMVYFVMASLFESVTHPLAILMSLPFALVGVVWTLTLTGTPFNLMARIGLLVLVGVVVNNGIVLIDHVNNLRRRGLSRAEALIEGCRERFRPILMTASTTILGLVPLAMGDSGVFELRYFPLARTVMGGLISSTALTLLVLPVYYELFDDAAIWVKRLWYSTSGQPEPSPSAGD
ncbi:MAG TPA: efflux RND transporter permease subunit [Bryobacteraceae bacterium]|nr:efflux RND transporter permease subunit [Bryobacteraceae bacterium]